VSLLRQSWHISHDCFYWENYSACMTRSLTAGDIFCRQDINEPTSVPVVFDGSRRQAFITTLQGSVLAFKHAQGSHSVAQVWTAHAGGPVLSTPAVLPGCGSLLVASVHGAVKAFSCSKGALIAWPM
jgi:hypothetical protein